MVIGKGWTRKGVVGAIVAIVVALTPAALADPPPHPSALPPRPIDLPPRPADLPPHPSGTTYYVSTTGNDANPCTIAAPCGPLTPNHAVSLARPGDTVAVLAGTYLMPAGQASSFWQIKDVAGTAAAPITLTAVGAVTVTRALAADPTSQEYDLVWVHRSTHLVIQGFTIIGARHQPDYNSAYMPANGELQLQDSSYITVRHNAVSDANNTCIKDQDGMPGIQIIGNIARNCGNPVPGPCLQAGNPCTNVPRQDHDLYLPGPSAFVQGNLLLDSTGIGITYHAGNNRANNDQIVGNTIVNAAGIQGESCCATIKGNLIYNVNSPCMDISTDNVLIADNLCVNGSDGGISLGPGTHATILNNTFYNLSGQHPIANNGGIGSFFTAPITVENNIFYEPSAMALFNTPFETGVIPTVDHNDYFHVLDTDGSGLIHYDQGGSITSDPHFVGGSITPVSGEPSIPDLRLQSGSPARRKAKEVGLRDGPPALDLGASCANCASIPSVPGT